MMTKNTRKFAPNPYPAQLENISVHEESKEYYEIWLKSDKEKGINFGLTVSYGMI